MNHSLAYRMLTNHLSRTYRAPDGRRVNLYVAYTKTQRQGKELVGMETAPLHEKADATVLRVEEGSVPANRTFIKAGARPGDVLVSHQRDGLRRSQSGKAGDDQTGLLRGRTDGALVLVSAEPRSDGSEEPWKAQEAFAAAVFPLMQEYLP
jgi:EpsI family protein